jgi:paraquat-inducible protein B
VTDLPTDVERGLDLPEPVVERRGRFSVVWIIPLVAAVIGAWLTYRAMTERGPTITISLSTAEGLEAGKTKVKYKDLELGVVELIELTDDLSGVVVTARMTPGSERLLTDRTRLWVVRARVSAGQVSGLTTLLSGAYIGMDPVLGGKEQRTFVGLESPPTVRSRDSGRVFVLRATELGSVDTGSPVYYRKVRVGQVVGYELDERGEFVTVKVFVEAPHDQRVSSNTRFWNASGVDVTLDAEGVRVSTESVVSILIGGVAFDTPSLSPGDPVPDGAEFPLFSDQRATLAQTYTLRQRYLLHFDESVGGLSPGAPVEFRGIQLGQVVDVNLEFDATAEQFRIPVVIEVEPERIAIIDGDAHDIANRLPALVGRGLRARLKTSNLLTGKLAVDLDMFPDAAPATVTLGEEYPELPTVPTPLGEITASLSRLVGRLEQVPIEQMGIDLQASLAALHKTLAQAEQLTRAVNTDLTPAVIGTARQAEQTLASANALIGPDSSASRELKQLLLELVEAARSVRLLAEHLEEHPESLLRGKEGPE